MNLPIAMEERRNLKRALARDDLILHYQPIVDPRTATVVSVEALLRGREEDRREWDIAQVTATAELGTEIFELEQWVIEQACRDAAEWLRRGLEKISLNLNVSAREFQNREFLNSLDHATSVCGIDPHRINLEITETASIHQPSLAEEVVNQLQERGFRIWLDDFGTGHSSLAWLKWFPVDGLKIPRSFVHDILEDERCEIIIDGVIEIAKGLDMIVVAEGVESRAQLEALLDKGVDLVQGYLFYRPLPIEELQNAMQAARSRVK